MIPRSGVCRLCIIKYCARKQTISFHKARDMVFVRVCRYVIHIGIILTRVSELGHKKLKLTHVGIIVVRIIILKKMQNISCT